MSAAGYVLRGGGVGGRKGCVMVKERVGREESERRQLVGKLPIVGEKIESTKTSKCCRGWGERERERESGEEKEWKREVGKWESCILLASKEKAQKRVSAAGVGVL